jgi:hypothetical protein
MAQAEVADRRRRRTLRPHPGQRMRPAGLVVLCHDVSRPEES